VQHRCPSRPFCAASEPGFSPFDCVQAGMGCGSGWEGMKSDGWVEPVTFRRWQGFSGCCGWDSRAPRTWATGRDVGGKGLWRGA
jgi:hypothetical protein